MKNLKIFLTFDHELPLGGLSSNYEQALFAPTLKVLELAKELKVGVTLFTDVLCALQFKEWDNEKFYKPYIEQLKNAVLTGHDVQLHLHPHWLTSSYKNGVFTPSNDFTLADFKNKKYPDDIAGIIDKGCSFLTSICALANPNYRCIAFRAGGYNLSSASDIIFSELYKNGIRYDSSICKGFYFKSALSEINFYSVPSLPNWFIGNDGNFEKPVANGILEIPIAGKPKSLLEVPTQFKMKKFQSRAPQSRGKQIHEDKPVGITYKIKQAFSSRMLSFDNYTYSPSYLMKILNYHVNKYSDFETIMLSVIGHPKSMSDYSLDLMQKFIEQTRKKYGDKVEFLTYTQLHSKLDSK